MARKLSIDSHLNQALRILNDMDDAITDMGGDEDEYQRPKLAKIRRCKDHIRKALEIVRLQDYKGQNRA